MIATKTISSTRKCLSQLLPLIFPLILLSSLACDSHFDSANEISNQADLGSSQLAPADSSAIGASQGSLPSLKNPAEPEHGPSPQLSPSTLISAAELKALIDANDTSVRVLEPARSNADYLKGHIPKAQFIHWVTDMTDPSHTEQYNNLSSAQFGKLMNSLGINNNSRIVIYDRLSSRLSTRLFWTLKYFGHERVEVLDGGHRAWTSKFKQSSEPVKYEASDYQVGKPNLRILAEMAFVEDHLDDPNTKFIDGRPAEQFKGKVAGRVFHTNKPHSRKGHIPKAINILWKDNFDQDGRFKSPAQLRALYQNAGIQPDQCVVTYCNEGLHAAPPWFVLTQLLGYENVRLYDSSMAEWANSKNPMTVVKKEGEQAKAAQPLGEEK